MFSTHSFRSRIALWTIAGVVFAGSSIVALPAQASWAYAGSMSFTRAGDAGSITVKPSETVAIESLHELTPDWSGWPLKRRAVLTKSPFTVAPQSGLTIDADSSWRYWQGSGSDDCYFFEDVAKLTVDDSMTCANSLYAADRLTVTNTTGVNKTVTTNASSQLLKNGKKKISGVGVDKSVSGVVQIEDYSILESGYAIDPDVESAVSFNFEFCIYEENIAAGDELTIIPNVFLNSGGIDSEFLTVYDDYDLDGDDIYENDLTFNVSPDGVQDDLRVSFSVAIADSAIAEMDGINDGLRSLGDVYQDGNSVIEPCADSETPRWGGYGFGDLASDSQPQMYWELDVDHDLPGYATYDSGNWDSFGSESDGFGGMFFKKNPAESTSSARVVLYGRDGIDSNFNGSGYVDLPTDAEGYMYIGSYGAGGSRFASIAETSRSAWTLTLGSKSSSGAIANTLTKKTLAKLCPSGFSPSWIAPISAPTTDPLLWLSCAKGSTQRHIIAEWATNKVAVITSLGSPKKKFTCVVPSIGMDTRATGDDAAIIVYTRTSKPDSDGYCGAGGQVSHRSLTTISAEGVKTSLADSMFDPWEGGPEPAYINIVAGSSPGSWIGLTYNSGEDMWSPSTLGDAFTLDVAGFDLLTDVALAETTDFGEWASVTPIAELDEPNTWTVAVTGSVTVDGDNVSRVTLGTLNTSTGQITNGDVGQLYEIGYSSSRHINQISSDSDGNMTWYFNNSDDGFAAIYWTLP